MINNKKNGIKVTHTPLPAIVCKYEPGMEDGLTSIVDVVTNVHINTDNLYQIHKTGYKDFIVCPYINNKRGRTFIQNGDYIVFESDGTKHVVSEENLWVRYQKC